MDRARRAEPYSSATVWTREIARNLAGHLDRLSKVHSCVDSASPKSAAHGAHGKSLPLKRAGQVSPLKLERSALTQRSFTEEREEHPVIRSPDAADEAEDCATTRDDGELLSSCDTPVRRRRAKALKKIRAVSKRAQVEVDEHHDESDPHENQRLVDRFTDPLSASNSHYEYMESLPAPMHTKKGQSVDYHKRQQQQRIFQENQALAKRLRNTKPTLSSKNWEKDDKWNQTFLKTQERRRQALQHEMARTLASPHSALIRVKHVVHPTGSSHAGGRLPSDYGLDESVVGGPVTAIEVTTHDSKTVASARDLRRRRSADEDAMRDHRQHSTAANHRRIMELRKQKERSNPSVRSGDSESDDATTDTGPPDELVSVRFTFSREGRRALCTPNGITGQFSPAVELEAALEASCHEDDALLRPVPTLETPLTSRFEPSEDTDGSDAVFCALQACIDAVVLISEHAVGEGSEAPTADVERHGQPPEGSTGSRGESIERPAETTETGSQQEAPLPEDQETVGDHAEDPREEPVSTISTDSPPDVPIPVMRTSDGDQPENPVALSVAVKAEDAETSMASARLEELRPQALEASGYGSEFDAEESTATAATRTTTTVIGGAESERVIESSLAAENKKPDEPEQEDDEYEDDHTVDDDNDDDHHLDAVVTTAGEGVDADGYDDEPQYDDDDVEPEAKEHEDGHGEHEQSYGDDGFADDE